MKISELLGINDETEIVENLDFLNHTRQEFDWHKEKSNGKEQLYMLVNQHGKVVRRHLTAAGVHAALKMPDYIKRYGKMFARKE
jgi:hypothetical protein